MTWIIALAIWGSLPMAVIWFSLRSVNEITLLDLVAGLVLIAFGPISVVIVLVIKGAGFASSLLNNITIWRRKP